MTKRGSESPNSDVEPKLSTLEMLYQEQWKEYHHTEYMIFVFLAAVAAADVALLRVQSPVLSYPSLIIATILGLTAVLVTWRQNQSRNFRLKKIIEPLEKELHVDHLIPREEPTAPRLGSTLLFLSIMLFFTPLVFLLLRICRVLLGLG